jgi:hypothetical protein
MHGTRNRFIKCASYSPARRNDGHFFYAFKETDQIDWAFLESYFTRVDIEEATCFRVEPTTTRAENCGK